MGKAIYYGIDNIVGALDNLCQGDGGFYYCVWQNSKSKCFQYNGGNYDDGIAFLRQNLDPYEEAGYTGDLYLKLHPNPCKTFYTWATEDISTLVICPTSRDLTPAKINGGYVPRDGYNLPQQKGGRTLMTEDQWEERQALKNLPETIAGIVAAEVAKLTPPVTEPELEADTMQSVMIGHLKNPQLMSKALDLIGQFIPMLKNPALLQQARQVAGVPDVQPKARSMQAPNITNVRFKEQAKPETVTDCVPTAESNTATVDTEKAPYMAGLSDQKKEMIAYNKRLDDALVRLAKIPGFDLADDLTALANYAEKNPEQFQGILPIVRNG